MSLDATIAKWGLLAIFAGAAMEGETVVATGGLFVYRGVLSYPLVVLCAAAGALLSDQFFFLVGRRYRESALFTRLRAKPAFAKAIRMMERHPVGFIFAFRFLWGLRIVSPVALGCTSIAWRRFAALNVMAALVWATLATGLGYAFASTLAATGATFYRTEHVLLAMLGLAVILALVGLLIRRRMLRD